MSNVLIRISTVLRAVVFWLGVIGAAIAATLAVLATHIDQPIVAQLVGYLAPAVTVIGVLVLIVRRVTEVIDSQRGLLPVVGQIIPEKSPHLVMCPPEETPAPRPAAWRPPSA
jgi:hypothetical protein